ncbi:N-6 DNA methylase [Actinomadura sp. K4S16]|uniref:N-6 DNA methylase n=1 Tax=Actinomadura sp. K4S16 TaxID=1316147 RepID=UPI0011EE48F6|nr:N-6 DNA methylase [Actinomadura sp. K4S16]
MPRHYKRDRDRKRGRERGAQLDLFAALSGDQPPTPADLPPDPDPDQKEITLTPDSVRPQDPPPATGGDADGGQAPPPPSPRPAPRKAPDSGRLHQLAERVNAAWHDAQRGNRHHQTASHIEIPLGVVAALTQIRQADPKGPDLAAQIIDLDGPGLLSMYRQIWAIQWITNPYLINAARPLAEWLDEPDDPDPATVEAVRHVTATALHAGLLDFTGNPDPHWRCETDVLGRVLVELRSSGASASLAEIHTPQELANAMAALTMPVDELLAAELERGTGPGGIHDPAAGTGGLLRAAAWALRNQGIEPSRFAWAATDIDPIAAACCAVNALVWDLGPDVLVHCGNTLTEPDGIKRERLRRKEIFALRSELMDGARMLAAYRRAMSLLEGTVSGRDCP